MRIWRCRISKISNKIGRIDNFRVLARKLSFLPKKLDIFYIRQHYLRILHVHIFQRLTCLVLLFLTPSYTLRNAHDIDIVHCRTELLASSFIPSAVSLWNELPDDIKSLQSKTSRRRRFKLGLKQLMKYFSLFFMYIYIMGKIGLCIILYLQF